MTFKELSNSAWLWILVIAGLLYVAGLAAAFMVKARKRCLELGIENTTIKKVIKMCIRDRRYPLIAALGLAFLAIGSFVEWRRSLLKR